MSDGAAVVDLVVADAMPSDDCHLNTSDNVLSGIAPSEMFTSDCTPSMTIMIDKEWSMISMMETFC